MDLVQTVRKEGSRGGRADFKWEDVKSSTHRENYLGHSLMAPVGRWQQNKDLSWYARSADATDEERQSAEDARREELRKVKQAEDDAMAKALGWQVPERREDGEGNANMVPVSEARGRGARGDISGGNEQEGRDSRVNRRGKDRERGARDDRERKERKPQRSSSSRDRRERRRRDRSRDYDRRRRSRSRSRNHSRERRQSHSRERRSNREGARYEDYETGRRHERSSQSDDRARRRRSRSPDRRHRRRDDYDR